MQEYFFYLCIMKKEMDQFEVEFAKAMSSPIAPMDEVLRYVAEAQGKRLRPTLVFLTAKLLGEINEASRRTALFVELVHTATLIHDDVVDGSDTRRGQVAVNARWNNITAVLCGDHLLSKAMLVLSDPADHRILAEMLQAALAMSEGELMQNAAPVVAKTANEASRDEAVHHYLDIINRKTARLIQACCVGGALSVGASDEDVARVGAFGLNLGLVFQMRDDILDADDPHQVELAKSLLPEYQERCQRILDGFPASDTLEELRSLVVFCAERNQ